MQIIQASYQKASTLQEKIVKQKSNLQKVMFYKDRENLKEGNHLVKCFHWYNQSLSVKIPVISCQYLHPILKAN